VRTHQRNRWGFWQSLLGRDGEDKSPQKIPHHQHDHHHDDEESLRIPSKRSTTRRRRRMRMRLPSFR
jgi:hypothetical protein